MRAKYQRGRVILSLTPKETARTIDALGAAVEDLADDARDARLAKEYESANRYERIWRQLDKLSNLLDKAYGK